MAANTPLIGVTDLRPVVPRVHHVDGALGAQIEELATSV